MPLRKLIEKNVESRIRSVQLQDMQQKLWITLWEEFSTFNHDTFRCLNLWVKNLKALFGSRVSVLKIDFKIDSLGTLVVDDYQSFNDKVVKGLKTACNKLSNLDHGFHDHLGEWCVSYNVDDAYRPLKGFQ